MKDTRSHIISLADELIRSKGYNAFSYADISKQLNIKNAAIHYYFPSKSDLGVAVIETTTEKFCETITAWQSLPYETQLHRYTCMHEKTRENKWVCLMGALSPVHDTLSPDMQQKLKEMAERILQWLTELLEKGKADGSFHFTETPRAKAYCIQSSLLASLLLNKVLQNDVCEVIRQNIQET